MTFNSMSLATLLMDFELEIFFDLGPYLIGLEMQDRETPNKKMI